MTFEKEARLSVGAVCGFFEKDCSFVLFGYVPHGA